VIVARYLPLLLLAAGVLILLLTGRPLFGDGALSARQSTFRSLAAASPVLEALIGIAVIGKPFLEHLQKNDWHSDLLAPEPLFVIVVVFEVSLFAMIGGILFFFYRAIRNINFFSGRRVRAPYSALFMIVPIVNVVVAPYVQYFAYHRSRAFAWPAQASALRAALLVFGTFALLLVTLTCGYAGDEATAGQTYDAASLLVIGTLTGLATGILQARIVDGIARAQEAYAAQIGALGSAATVAAKRESRARRILQSASVGILLLLALLAALNPALASRTGQLLVGILSGG
jgi:heme/copper-type cytochrome/quinol oxidase subunit 3